MIFNVVGDCKVVSFALSYKCDFYDKLWISEVKDIWIHGRKNVIEFEKVFTPSKLKKWESCDFENL